MKKVWVNRFNPDGSMKPMSEWVLRETTNKKLHYFKGTRKFYQRRGDDENVHIYASPENGGELFLEYLGDQRGDGWFYVADGHLPPNSDEVVLAWDLDESKPVAVDAKTVNIVYRINKNITDDARLTKIFPCWQPITPPKFL